MDQNTGAAAEMPRYRSHKTVWALKIATVVSCGTDTTTDENPIVEIHFEDTRFAPRKLNIRNRPEPQDGWYYVQYGDGYWSFSPAAQFEAGNTLESKLTEADAPTVQGIGWAVKQMHNGSNVRRAGWNGKGMWLGFIPGDQWGLGSGQNAFDYGLAGPGKLLPWIGMRTAQGDFVPWLASQTALLATDWEPV